MDEKYSLNLDMCDERTIFTEEQCASELSYLLFNDAEKMNELFEELSQVDQEVLYAFYLATKNHENSWTMNEEFANAMYRNRYRIFIAPNPKKEKEII
jgi:hypothetical protein